MPAPGVEWVSLSTVEMLLDSIPPMSESRS
jgi:hypothetical protein